MLLPLGLRVVCRSGKSVGVEVKVYEVGVDGLVDKGMRC